MATQTATSAKILIVDDEVAILQALGMYLEQLGYNVDTVVKFRGYFDGRAKNDHPDVIILDIMLNQENGAQIAKELKADVKTKNIPLIMISALPDGQRLAKESGADSFLAKPFDLTDLEALLDKYSPVKK